MFFHKYSLIWIRFARRFGAWVLFLCTAFDRMHLYSIAFVWNLVNARSCCANVPFFVFVCRWLTLLLLLLAVILLLFPFHHHNLKERIQFSWKAIFKRKWSKFVYSFTLSPIRSLILAVRSHCLVMRMKIFINSNLNTTIYSHSLSLSLLLASICIYCWFVFFFLLLNCLLASHFLS